MKLTPLNIPELVVIEPEVFKDDRGFFYEAYNQEKFNKALGKEINFVQDNQSFSKKGVLRGLHFQEFPYQQAKLIKVLRGSIYDVCVDMRKNSKTYGEWCGIKLNDNSKKFLYVPKGFAHGFLAMTNEVEILYKTDEYYHPDSEKTLIYNDKKLNIKWPEEPLYVSKKDLSGKKFDDL